MEVIVANFGQENWAWPDCLERGTIAVMDDARVHPYFLADDRDGYIQAAREILRTRSGEEVPTMVASRWFNLTRVLLRSDGDLWIHRDGDRLWWTHSTAADATSDIVVDPNPRRGERGARVYLYRKPSIGWSSKDGRGRQLSWDSVHPRVKGILTTQATFATLQPDNAAYARALIEGRDLARWHDRPDWRSRLADAKGKPVRFYDVKQNTIAEAVEQMYQTAAASGSISLSVRKDKQIGFDNPRDAEIYLASCSRLAQASVL